MAVVGLAYCPRSRDLSIVVETTSGKHDSDGCVLCRAAQPVVVLGGLLLEAPKLVFALEASSAFRR